MGVRKKFSKMVVPNDFEIPIGTIDSDDIDGADSSGMHGMFIVSGAT